LPCSICETRPLRHTYPVGDLLLSQPASAPALGQAMPQHFGKHLLRALSHDLLTAHQG
jgi:hypothetical protein